MKKLLKLTAALAAAFLLVCAASTPVSAKIYYSTRETDKMQLPILAVFLITGGFIVLGVAMVLLVKKKKESSKHYDPYKESLKEKRTKNKSDKNRVTLPVSDLVPNNYNEIIGAQIRKHDPDFSSVKFCDWSKNVFIRLMGSLSENELKAVRLLTTTKTYGSLETELNGMLSTGDINIFDNIQVNRCYLHLLKQNSSSESVTVYLYGTMQNYMAVAASREPLPGHITETQPFKYLLTFSRSIFARTVYVNGIQAVCCHCCGAPTTLTSDVKCSYCGSPLTPADDNWLLSDIRIMKDNSPLDDRGIVIE